eukprot:gb/GEZN01009991.1/.p2 GENE.gb/GEZN01009991.1/~~gb/GEZN01009991.1/.p2  ORF type:complete len:176 (+),score=25.32 gb/GEZN01009991.1/:74-601(+)
MSAKIIQHHFVSGRCEWCNAVSPEERKCVERESVGLAQTPAAAAPQDLVGFIASFARGLEDQVTACVQSSLGNVVQRPELRKVYDLDGNVVAEWDGVLSGTVMGERAIVWVEAKTSITRAHIARLKEKQDVMNHYIRDCMDPDGMRGKAYDAVCANLRAESRRRKQQKKASQTET